MSLSALLRSLKSYSLHLRRGNGRGSAARRRHAGGKLSLDWLEDRTLLSPYLVNTTKDWNPNDPSIPPGYTIPGSLRDAINQINADTSHALYASPSNPSLDEIDFQITALSDTGGGYDPTTGVATIRPQIALPPITNAVMINGYTQGQGTRLAASPNTHAMTDPDPSDNAVLKIDLDGSQAGASAVGLDVNAPQSVLRGLDVTNWGGYGIWLDFRGSSNCSVAGNFLGTDVTGRVAMPNGSGPLVLGNTPNGAVVVNSPGNTIGGTDPGSRNVISGNASDGLVVADSELTLLVSGNVVAGNFIGTDITGRSALGNGRHGVEVGGVENGNVIGGTTPAARNIISGNAVYDIDVGGAKELVIQGNYVGTDVTGSTALASRAQEGINAGNTHNTTVLGNVISGNFYGVVSAQSDGTVIQGNFIGTDATGMHPLGNHAGIYSFGSGSPVLIGGTTPGAGNVISGNEIGIFSYGNGNLIQGNFIGTDVSGKQALSNGEAFRLGGGSDGNTIGGTTAAARNIISGGSSIGSSGNLFEGNYIGTDITGTMVVGQGGSLGFTSGATNNTIGGTTAAARNIIVKGVVLDSASGNLVEGNYIGTDVTGTKALGALVPGYGVLLTDGTFNNTIGGTTPGAGNLIAYTNNQSWDGAVVLGSGATGNLVQGNTIIHSAKAGVLIDYNANKNTIGGMASGAGNTIAYNGRAGVSVGNGSTGDAILSNSIHDNGGLGIELDSATNCNHNQAAPVLQLAVSAGGTTVITGMLHSVANTAFTLQFFSNVAPDPSGYGEGQTLLGNFTVTTDVNGNAKFLAVLSAGVPIGQGYLSATATNQSTNDTSQFAQDLVNIVPNTAGLYIGINPTLLQQLLALLPRLGHDGDLNLDAGNLEALIAQLLGL